MSVLLETLEGELASRVCLLQFGYLPILRRRDTNELCCH
jgi:hypothetical protein